MISARLSLRSVLVDVLQDRGVRCTRGSDRPFWAHLAVSVVLAAVLGLSCLGRSQLAAIRQLDDYTSYFEMSIFGLTRKRERSYQYLIPYTTI